MAEIFVSSFGSQFCYSNSHTLNGEHKTTHFYTKNCAFKIRFSVGSASAVGPYSSFFDALGGCGNTGDMLYAPNSAIQTAVVKAALAIWVSLSLHSNL
jgi:hypothetical protein